MNDRPQKAKGPLRLLVINPNTSEAITARLRALAEEEAGDGVVVSAVTARFGAPYISDRAGAAVAAEAVLDVALAEFQDGAAPDAIVIACFGDPGLKALQEAVPCPVVGFAEAGLLAAAAEPGPFLVATNGEAWCDMLSELSATIGLSDRIAGFLSIGDAAARDAELCRAMITEEAERIGAARVVLGGAGLIPILGPVARGMTLPLVDPHRAAIRKAIALART
ncbi:Asp/Glu/hydantoin racemase [Kaistia sp. 32K]|uniref:aspartate/glutamate racemase family protein n=1 Tax=Kaistia sp. 32K TaxID=2795690 RepID=UPI001916B335|nr:aspartate/glutamate racemase family protein [Kaistia sp. 32K]BCP55345.1 Asp/Glu/hydantoin racemase [Kaistia sp. 32K]